jgi:flagellar L-ring protein precursor FlgH
MKTYIVTLGALVAPAAAAAQAAPADSSAPPAAVAQAPASSTVGRAGWLSDRRALRMGDILTVVVDEQTSARERVSKTASADRDQSLGVDAGLASSGILGSSKSFGTASGASSRDVGEANRSGDLVAVLSVRVVGIEPSGVVRIEGTKTVTVDGRNQVVSLAGVVRPDDVTSDNLVSSARIAEAVISYKGKKIGPRQGIIGKILGLLWP